MLRRESRLSDVALESLNERREEIEVLLLKGSEVGADGAEGLSTRGSTEAAGDLVLDLGHADGLFGEVVAERNERIDGEAQDVIGMLTQSSPEIERNALRRAPTFAARRWGGIGRFAFGQNGIVLGTNGLDAHRRQPLTLSRYRCMVGGDQQIDPALGPGLLAFLMDESQFAQVMGIAQRMRAVQFPVRSQTIMGQRPFEPVQETEVLEGDLAALGVQSHPGQGLGDGGVQPVEVAGPPVAGFIGARHLGLGHRIRDALHRRREKHTGFADHGLNRAGRDRQTIQVGEQLGRACDRQHVVLRQINGECLDAGSILHRGDDIDRKLAAVSLAAGTAHLMNPVLGDFHRYGRQVEYWARLCRGLARERRTAGIAHRGQRMIRDVIRISNLLQRCARVAGLTTGRTRTLLAHRLRLLQAFGRGGYARIAAVLRQLPAQIGYLRLQTRHFRLQLHDLLA